MAIRGGSFEISSGDDGVHADSALSVTGGTWVYSFDAPDGSHLLSIEMYRGMIVTSYGMYNYQ